MRNATITKIRPRDYMVDLYENGSWIDGRRGTRGEVEQIANKFVNWKQTPQRFIMAQYFLFYQGKEALIEKSVGVFFSFWCNNRLDNCPVSRYNDYVVYEKELKLMTNTESNYVYTLDDLYRIFQQTEASSDRVSLLREWEGMNLPYLINWDGIISRIHVIQGLDIYRISRYIGI